MTVTSERGARGGFLGQLTATASTAKTTKNRKMTTKAKRKQLMKVKVTVPTFQAIRTTWISQQMTRNNSKLTTERNIRIIEDWDTKLTCRRVVT